MSQADAREISKGLVIAGYLTALVYVVLPLGDLVVMSWPPTPGRLEWRVGVVGTVGQILAFPTLALALAALLASAVRDRAVLAAISVTALLAGLLAVGMIFLFALDSIQVRATLVPEIKGTFTRQIAKSCLNLLLYGTVNVWVAVAGLRSVVRDGRREGREGGISPGVVSASKRSSYRPDAGADA